MARTSALRRPPLAAVPERAAATPTELLQLLDAWLSNAGHERGSTWRRAIGETLSAQQQAPQATPAAGLAALLGEAAAVAHRVDVDACEPDTAEDWEAEARSLCAAVCRLGWLADLGASMAGAEPVRGDAAVWMLSADARAAVLAVGADHA
jgi:hypothetical protein